MDCGAGELIPCCSSWHQLFLSRIQPLGNIGFFQSMCLLGYCLFPMDVAAIVTAYTTNMIAKWIVVLVSRHPAFLAPALMECSQATRLTGQGM